MSYNTRRGTPAQNNYTGPGGIGSRRPVVTTNFVPGGQLTPQKGGIQQNQQQGYNTQPQANRPQQQQAMQQRSQQQQSTPKQQPQQQQQQQPQQQQPVQPKQEKKEENGSQMQVDGEKKKWPRMKIPKKEKIKRRNIRLCKLLQPKNALMILNELGKNPTFTVSDYMSTEGTQYKAVVTVEGVDHDGFGKSKINAKNSAAENALKYLIRNKKLTQVSETAEDGSTQMDISEDGNESEAPLPWQQVASFALFKLFCSWGDNPNLLKEDQHIARELKPAKKLPENAASMNPLMVIHQMYPNTQFEELPQTGAPPNAVFNMKVTLEGKVFTGSGTSKKLAKKNAAFVACNTVLGIQYPKELYNPEQN
ncbi:hypothetical protein HHI36_015180 [Cryptolaemus montrouzieri]|uniref:DRBM domain-containing protein n=1 Tax=Cryptolaemus montrouzieri TaxID=559131 RepID=A0ABD2N560_9CUCU